MWSSSVFILKPFKKKKKRYVRLENAVAHPKSLWTAGVVDEVASPRKGRGPSRHHELSGRNTSSVSTVEGTVIKNTREQRLHARRLLHHLLYLIHDVAIQ